MGQQVKVLYIAGHGRCGSTILGQALGEVEGFTHVGELLELWDAIASGKDPCGCGAPLVACNMWGDVLKAAYGGLHESLVSQMLQFHHRDAHAYTLLRTTTSRGLRILQRHLAEPLARYERLYCAIQRVFNCDLIVDSSKSPFYGYVLQLMEGIDPYVVHLTRDPRASAYSWLRRTAQRGGWLAKRHKSPLASSITWNYRNGVVEVMGKSKRFRRPPLCLRYEDFVANPRRTLQRILSFVGVTSSSLPLQDEHSLNLKIQHTVSGNPNRFKTGKIDIREDLAWKTEMKRRDRMLVTAATWPLLIKYGYASGSTNSVEP